MPVAVISSHVSEHSMSTTTLPFVPAEVPCTLISVQGARKVDGISVRRKTGERRRGEGEERRTVDVGDVEVARILRAYVRGRRVALSEAATAADCEDLACMKDTIYGSHLVNKNRILHVLN